VVLSIAQTGTHALNVKRFLNARHIYTHVKLSNAISFLFCCMGIQSRLGREVKPHYCAPLAEAPPPLLSSYIQLRRYAHLLLTNLAYLLYCVCRYC